MVAYCFVKCGVERVDRERRGVAADPEAERRKFVACFTRCITPVDLPERTGDERESKETNDDDVTPKDRDSVEDTETN